MSFSANEIKRLGNRLRNSNATDADIIMLETWRESYDPLLIGIASRIDSILGVEGLQFLLSGRSKRTKSIIRKLRRNHDMDLSRMQDIVGLRVILSSITDQEKAMKLLANSVEQKKVSDYRGGDKLYRAVHMVIKDDSKFVEIQLRTLPQHVWAVESEAFGEKVKEGISPEHEKLEYLKSLSKACVDLDQGKSVKEANYRGTPLIEERLAISGLHTKLARRFVDAVMTKQASDAGKTFLVVFDNELRQLMHNDAFEACNRPAALERYRWLTRTLTDQVRFETLIFNSSSDKALAVTHPRFFEL